MERQHGVGVGASCLLLSSCFLSVSSTFPGEVCKGTEEFPSLFVVVYVSRWFSPFSSAVCVFFKSHQNPPVLVPSSACDPDAWHRVEQDVGLMERGSRSRNTRAESHLKGNDDLHGTREGARESHGNWHLSQGRGT